MICTFLPIHLRVVQYVREHRCQSTTKKTVNISLTEAHEQGSKVAAYRTASRRTLTKKTRNIYKNNKIHFSIEEKYAKGESTLVYICMCVCIYYVDFPLHYATPVLYIFFFCELYYAMILFSVYTALFTLGSGNKIYIGLGYQQVVIIIC